MSLQQVEPAAEPLAFGARAEQFYTNVLRELADADLPFLLAGTYAVAAYTGITRKTKDIDVFCRPEDTDHILQRFRDLGYRTEMHDPRWIAKVYKGKHFLDVIFASSNSAVPITEEWFEDARECEVLGTTVKMVGPTELIWSKVFVQNRDRYDGADVAHIILKQRDAIDWARLLRHLDGHWEVLLIHLIQYRWIYPGERDAVPRWVMERLTERLKQDLSKPAPNTDICNGRMFSKADYEVDVAEWDYKDTLQPLPDEA
jgi:predicted nucleotidyltransferase